MRLLEVTGVIWRGPRNAEIQQNQSEQVIHSIDISFIQKSYAVFV